MAPMTNSTSTTFGRAIDRHESAIVDVLDLIEEIKDGAGDYTIPEAFEFVASINGLTTDRLIHLTTVWCAIAGIPAPEVTK